jgi:hypothetical protein
MDPKYIKGPNGETLKLRYDNKPETWTEKELMASILKEIQEIKSLLNPTVTKQDVLDALNRSRDHRNNF